MQNSTNILLKTAIVPGWIYRSLIRNKRAASDLNNYAALRSYLTLDDMAEWFYLNNRMKLKDEYLNDLYLTEIFSGLSESEKNEINSSVVPLSGSEKTTSSVTTRLTTPKNGILADGCDREYEFVIVDNVIYVILHEGFLTFVQDQNKLFEFVQNYLKKCYFMTSIPDVSKTALYRTYVKHLASLTN